jgi:HAD superfamily hydrolase (TIGR01509 family)
LDESNVRLARCAPIVRRPAAVIFDMDGLMLDTEPLAALAWGEAAAALGVSFDMSLARAMIGRNFADCATMLREHYAVPHPAAPYPVDALLGSWHAAYDAIVSREGLALKPGVLELLEWLDANAIPRAVATSTRRERARAKLEHTALLPRFHDLVGGDEVARGKPAPDIYVEAARRLRMDAAACIALEDSEPGIRAALAAGMTAIMVPDLHPPSPELVALNVAVLPSLHDVLRHLAALPAS